MRAYRTEWVPERRVQNRDALLDFLPKVRPPEEIVHVRSVHDLATFIRKTPQPNLKYLASEDSIEYTNRENKRETPFNRAKNTNAAAELALYGWREGRERLASYRVEMERELRDRITAPRFVQDLSGFEVDVPTFLTGQPEHMLSYQEGQTNARTVDVVVDINVRCNACGRRQHDQDPTDPTWVLLRGAAITMLMKALTLAGYKPRLTARTTTVYEVPSASQRWPNPQKVGLQHGLLRTVNIPIHEPGAPLDIDRINFVLSHESMIRRLEWRLHEFLNVERFGYPPDNSPDNKSLVHGGRGSFQPVGRVPLGASHTIPFMSDLPIGDVFVPGLPQMRDMTQLSVTYGKNHLGPTAIGHLVHAGAAFRTIQDAVQWVFSTLEMQGVKLDG